MIRKMISDLNQNPDYLNLIFEKQCYSPTWMMHIATASTIVEIKQKAHTLKSALFQSLPFIDGLQLKPQKN